MQKFTFREIAPVHSRVAGFKETQNQQLSENFQTYITFHKEVKSDAAPTKFYTYTTYAPPDDFNLKTISKAGYSAVGQNKQDPRYYILLGTQRDLVSKKTRKIETRHFCKTTLTGPTKVNGKWITQNDEIKFWTTGTKSREFCTKFITEDTFKIAVPIACTCPDWVDLINKEKDEDYSKRVINGCKHMMAVHLKLKL